MRIALVSDAHGARRHMDRLAELLPPVEMLCFLGDVDRDGTYLSYALAETQPRAAFHAVAGNNDPFSSLPGTLLLPLGGCRVLLTHGHLFHGIRSSRRTLAAKAADLDCPLVFYGHTHVPQDERVGGVRLINPGALLQGRWALVELGGEAVEASFLGLDEPPGEER